MFGWISDSWTFVWGQPWYVLLAAYLVFNSLPMWLIMLKYRHIRPKEGDKEKYGPFLRNDIDNWSFFKTIFTHFFLIPRYLSALLVVYITGISVLISTIGLDRTQPISKQTYRTVTGLSRLCLRYFCFIFGCISYRNERPKVSYSHWLGPDWKPSYEGAGINISNHSNYLDIFLNFLLDDPCPAYLQREGTRVVPVLGFVSDCMQCLFMQRGDTKEQRALLLEKIQERQIQSEQGLSVPIHIYPEGATTNGSAILPFKKGAFASLRGVKPYAFCYWSALGNCCFGTPISFFLYGVILLTNFYSMAVRRELPVFTPNDYFWEHHWQEGKEEKWEAFARAMRLIIQSQCVDPMSPTDPATGLGSRKPSLSQVTVEDKLAYKAKIEGSKQKQVSKTD